MFKSLNTPAMQFRRAQAGITLIEVSIGLIIAAIIAAAAFIAFQNNSRRQEVRENISAITEISSEARNKFVKTGLGTSLNTDAAKSANLLDPIGGNANSYGEAVTFTVGTATVNPKMVWPNVPEDQCVDLVIAIRENFSSVLVGTTEVAKVVAPATALATIGAVDTACVDGVDLTIEL